MVRGNRFHEAAKVPGLGIVAVGIEMRRAIGVWIRLATEGAGNKAADAAYQEGIDQVLLGAYTLVPSIVSENLTHAAALLPGIDSTSRIRQLAQKAVIESPFRWANVPME